MRRILHRRSTAAVLLLTVSIAVSVLAADPEPQKPINALLGQGYLDKADLPDSLALVPAPPAGRDPAFTRDRKASKAGLALGHRERWQLAISDADLRSPAATGALSCAAGFEISPTATPAIDRLLRRALPDLGAATGRAKDQYKRPRPFMVNGKPMCSPDFEKLLRADGSYPSGHSAIGYGWGLILAEIVPDRATPLVARGQGFGDNRRICNVHWLSDIEAGRSVGAAVVARLHASPAFQADLQAAKAEALAARSTPPSRDCAAEAEAFLQKP